MADLKYPNDVKYAQSDEWLRVDGDTATLGISDYAQDALNDLTYTEFLKEVGESIDAGDAVAEVESVKATSEIYCPVAGEIIEVNTALEDDPELVNSDPYGEGWLVKIKVTDDSGLAELMDADAYKTYNEDR
jgi:glycine cleavage system H protein